MAWTLANGYVQHMRRHVSLVTLATVVLALGTIAQPASGHGKPSSPFAKPSVVNSLLLTEWWANALETPVPENPLAGNADRCIMLGRHVLAPAFDPSADISCTVRPHTWIFAIVFTNECSSEEDPPFFGATPRERKACAIAGNSGITTREVIIDGKTYDASRHRVQSFDRRVKLPEDDLFGVDAGSLRFTADAWAPLIEPLKPGHHVVAIHVVGEFPGSAGVVDVTIPMQLEVTRR
jgi:hypothetical protein